jgi:hypothetical protein
VGRGCGDASRALLFAQINEQRKTPQHAVRRLNPF